MLDGFADSPQAKGASPQLSFGEGAQAGADVQPAELGRFFQGRTQSEEGVRLSMVNVNPLY